MKGNYEEFIKLFEGILPNKTDIEKLKFELIEGTTKAGTHFDNLDYEDEDDCFTQFHPDYAAWLKEEGFVSAKEFFRD